MNDDEAILTEQGVRDLRRAAWWCKREWVCLSLGGLLALVGYIPFFASDIRLVVFVVGLATGLVGGLLSLPSSFLALLGILFPGRSGRHGFLLLFLVSSLPLVGFVWFSTKVNYQCKKKHVLCDLQLLSCTIRAFDPMLKTVSHTNLTTTVPFLRSLAGTNDMHWADMSSDPDILTEGWRDPWGMLYHVVRDDETHMRLWSNGSNRVDDDGNGDDICRYYTVTPDSQQSSAGDSSTRAAQVSEPPE